MLLPRMESVSIEIGSFPLSVILTFLRCVFIATSTPVTVPWITVPVLSTVSVGKSFIGPRHSDL